MRATPDTKAIKWANTERDRLLAENQRLRKALENAPAVPSEPSDPVGKAIKLAIAMADWYNGPRADALEVSCPTLNRE